MKDLETKLSKVTTAMAAAIPVLSRCVDRVAEILTDTTQEYDDKMASHLVWLTLQMAGISNELRQLEKHDRVMSRTPEQRWALVLEYIRTELSSRQRLELSTMLEDLKTVRVMA